MTDVRACVFDAYGTLFDLALGEKVDRLGALWREKQLQYTWLRAVQGEHADFWQVTGDALDFAMDSLELKDAALRDRLMAKWRYFAERGVKCFFPQVSILFEVTDETQHHHVPLLLSPFGYSTYRGS